MTESEAIKDLERLKTCIGTENSNEVIDMAIKSLEKQIEMKKYCDEQGCTDCQYHNPLLKDNRCMNDFIIETEDTE